MTSADEAPISVARMPRGSVGFHLEGRADSAQGDSNDAAPHPITLFMLAHADIPNPYDYMYESMLRMEILFEMLASVKEGPSFSGSYLGRENKGRQRAATHSKLSQITTEVGQGSKTYRYSQFAILDKPRHIFIFMNGAYSCRLLPKFQFRPPISQIGKNILVLYTYL
jgi:hypothetical protein